MSERTSRIAVVGMAGRFPGAPDLEAFWANLRDGVESLTTFSDEALEAAGVPRSILNDPRCVKVAPSLGRVDLFDAAFFSYSGREAERLDPQQRLLLECGYEALENAGCVPSRFAGRIGVYVGVGSSGYLEPLIRGVNVVTELESVLGNDKDYAATRLSYKLDLRGPSVTVQTACSTSLVAIHMACQALLAGECDLALAGGAKVRLPQEAAYLHQEGGILSPDGRCRAFDAGANGTAFGSGAGLVALKRLEDAIEAGDLIDAVILGSAANNDGAAKVGYVAPSEEGQAEVIAEALAVAGVDAATVGYVEAHGTGTPLGDPIEVAALTRAFRSRARGPAACAIGSVKTNIGHLETAAGVAGFIKTVLAMKHRCLPASLNFRQPNPQIDFARTPFRVNVDRADWRPRGDRLRAGVSSFGIGGTNAHVVLEEAPDPKDRSVRTRGRVHLLPLSARSAEALRTLSERCATELAAHGSDRAWLEDACASAALRRTHFEHRLCVAGESADVLAAGLRDASSSPSNVTGGGRARLVFVYSGQGSQWIGMGRGLLREEPAFASRLRECDAALRPSTGFSVLEVLQADGDARWKRVEVIQPLLFAMQLSLSAAWSARGVEPDAVIGHSLGEVAASVVAGSLSLEDGAYVIGTRSRMVSRTCGRGRMALVELSPPDARRALSDWPGVSIASHHGPDTVLISGGTELVEQLVRSFDARGIFARLVDVDYASHSAQMDEILGELGAAMAAVRGRRAERATQCSTVLADVIGGEEVGGDYWVRNLREPVRFHESVEKLVGLGHTLFLEVSPHPILTPTIERTLGDRGIALGTLRRESDELLEVAESLARLYRHGVNVDWSRSARGDFVRLPTYPWQRQRYWIPEVLRRSDPASQAHAWLRRAIPHAADPGTTIWQGTLGAELSPQLADHRVQRNIVVAGAVWLEAALRAARGQGGGSSLEDVELMQVLALGESGTADVQLIASAAAFEVLSAPEGEKAWTRHARGRFAAAQPPPADAWDVLAGAKQRCTREVEGATLYRRLIARGILHGARYAGVRRMWVGDGEAVGEIALDRAEPGAWVVEPWWLDACIQVLGAAEDASDPRTYLPARIGRVTLHDRPPAGVAWVHARWRRVGDELEGELSAHHEGGGPWLEVRDVRLRPVGGRRHPIAESLLAIDWERQPLERNGADATGSWLVLSDGTIGDELIECLEAAGARCERIRRVDADFGRALETVPLCAGIVFLFAAEAEEPSSADEIARAQQRGALSALALVQALAKASFRDPPRLWLVTRGAVARPGDPPARVTHAPIWGLARTVVHEYPEFRCSCVDLGVSAAVGTLAEELLAGASEEQIVLRPDGRSVARLVHTHLDGAPPEFRRRAGGRPFQLEIGRPGSLETLALREMARRPPGAGEVEIEVEAAGLNLLDVLIALGVLKDDAPQAASDELRLGGECSGRIVRRGPGVDGLEVGDRVMAIAHDAFRSFVVANARMTAKVPPHVKLEAAAGFPIAFLTAHLALRRVARLEPSERVLIHAASTGVGRAAVQIAQQIRAEIFATAGSEAKRERLRRAGVTHVMSSRSLDFVGEVKKATAGEGVDVVLNSLSGDFIGASFGLLRDYGRFVDLGKRDYYEDRKIGLAPFLRSLTFSLFDLRAMLYTRPRVVEEAFAELAAALSDRTLEPLAVECFPVADAAGAFQTMAEARHTEKIVITMRAPEANIARQRSTRAGQQGAYLVTGGLGALGLELAAHLARTHGVRRLVLMGRRPPSPEAEAKIRAIRDAGAAVRVEQGNAADLGDVNRVVQAAVPLVGVVHAAGVLDDGILLKQDARRFAAVMAPKIGGAWNLHVATKDLSLDTFVLFSSTASLLGAPGQGNYAAASAFLDALAHHRRALGLPALAIQFGPWGEIGLAAAGEERGRRAAAQGMRSLTPEEGLAAFDLLSSSGFVEIGVVSLDLRQWLESYPLLADSPLFRRLVVEKNLPTVGGSRFRETLFGASGQQRRSMLERHLREEAARVLRMSPDAIEPSASLIQLGLSSLTALEYRNRLEASLGATLPATLIWSHSTTAALTEQIAARLGCALPGRPPIADRPRPVDSVLAMEIEQLSDAEAEQALLAALDGIETES